MTSVPGLLDVGWEGALLPLLVPLLHPESGTDGPAPITRQT